MTKLQFRVLFREFLFRMVDLEVLSAHAQGGMSKLFGQFASLLIFISLLFAGAALGFGNTRLDPQTQLMFAWSAEQSLIASTMLVVGLFAVLSWDSTFPDRRDVLVLAPLPIRPRTLFLAKIAAVGTALSVTVGTLHLLAGITWPLALNKKTPALSVPALTTQPAIAPVVADGLQAVLNRDLEPALRSGALAPETKAGVVIGVSEHGVRRVFAYGTARPDSIFEIGSLTKTFTALVLAQMVTQGKVSLDQPVRELLPAGTAAKPPGREIRLLDLATHHSGLPPMPANFDGDGVPNPGADYHAAQLYEYLAKRGLARSPGTAFRYSNLGFGLLGQALSEHTGVTYQNLLQEAVTGPLGMSDTVLSLAPAQQSRMIQAYDLRHRPVPAWDLDALAGAGAIRSTAGDMLTYLEAHLHAEHASVLSEAIRETQKLRADVGPGMRIALAWMYKQDTGTYWHDGSISGYSSHAFFNPKADYAAVVLLNQAAGPMPFCDSLAEHIRQRLAGEPAISLASIAIPATGGFFGMIRLFAVYWVTMLAAGAFIFCCVLGVQGLVAQLLPRRLFLRVSSFLQMAAFSLFVCVYFLQPAVASPDALIAAQSDRLLAWSPSYWFLGLFQQLNGSPALATLARRAWIGLALVMTGTALAYALSYFRTLRRIVEEPDITPGARGANWLPRFGDLPQTAVAQFSIRTLLRSRQHRIILAFFLGIAFAITIFLLRTPHAQEEFAAASASDPWHQVSVPLLASSIMIMAFWVVGTRVVFSMPLDLRASWVFRVTPLRGGPQCLVARRRSLYASAVGPTLAASAALFLSIWPWRQAVAHLVILGFLGTILAELCLHGTHKIPFACSYLPGQSNFHITFWFCIGLVGELVDQGAKFEQRALHDAASFATMLAILSAIAVWARWRTLTLARGEELQFEEVPSDAILKLGL